MPARPDSFQKFRRGLARISVENFISKFHHRYAGTSGAKGVLRPGNTVRLGPRIVKRGRVARIRINESCRLLFVITLFLAFSRMVTKSVVSPFARA
jgi:hypothetical protein